MADVRGRIEDHDAVGGGQERRHVDVVSDRIEVPVDLPNVVPVLVQPRPFAIAGTGAYSGRSGAPVMLVAGDVTVSPWILGARPCRVCGSASS
jgi:hypothetical protein